MRADGKGACEGRERGAHLVPDKTHTGAESNGRKASGRMTISPSLGISPSLSLLSLSLYLSHPGRPDSIEAIRDLASEAHHLAVYVRWERLVSHFRPYCRFRCLHLLLHPDNIMP